MTLSLDTYLRGLSYDFYLKRDSNETDRIAKSIDSLFQRLDSELGLLIKQRFVFGSYDRDTILPRKIDERSDVDIMVVFNHTEYERTPETYRAWLKNFADKQYKDRYGSEVVKSFPTVTVRLNNINFDLVPAREEEYVFFGSTLYIPDSGGGWQETNPTDVKKQLTESNTKYNNIVRPIIRLLKAWNCSSGYPFDSYKLELEITEMNFYGDNVQSGLVYAANQIGSFWTDSQSKSSKISSLRTNLEKMNKALELNDLETAKNWLHKAIPMN